MKILVLITARGGSKVIPKKNIKVLAGKPLLQYTIDAALSIFDKADICLSTDSEEIKTVAETCGLVVPFLRPSELATDSAGSNGVVLHALDFYERQGKHYDSILLLQPTSPFRNADHIREAIKQFDDNTEMLVGVTEAESSPYQVLFEEDTEGNLQKSKEGHFVRRQDCPIVWRVNGSVYLFSIAALKNKGDIAKLTKQKFVMDQISSLDIDSELDWQFAEFIFEKGLNK